MLQIAALTRKIALTSEFPPKIWEIYDVTIESKMIMVNFLYNI